MPPRRASQLLAQRLGIRIRALRESAGLTQERLAWECDIDKGYLSQLEAGKRVASVPVLFDLANKLGVEVADVVGFDLDRPRLRLLDATRRSDGDEATRALNALGLGKNGS